MNIRSAAMSEVKDGEDITPKENGDKDGKTVQFEVEAGKVQELCAQVDNGLLQLGESDLLEIGSGLDIRMGRLRGAKKTKLQILTEISSFIEKKCSESVESSLNLLTPLLNDIKDRLKKTENTETMVAKSVDSDKKKKKRKNEFKCER